MYIYILPLEVMLITRMRISSPLGTHVSGGDNVLCKENGCNLHDTFRLIGHAISMAC